MKHVAILYMEVWNCCHDQYRGPQGSVRWYSVPRSGYGSV